MKNIVFKLITRISYPAILAFLLANVEIPDPFSPDGENWVLGCVDYVDFDKEEKTY